MKAHLFHGSGTGSLHVGVSVPCFCIRRASLAEYLVFAVRPILHVYIERSGYAMEEASPDEDIHPPSHKEKYLEGKQQLTSHRHTCKVALRY